MFLSLMLSSTIVFGSNDSGYPTFNKDLKPHLVAGGCAGVAIAPFIYGFQMKSALLKNEPFKGRYIASLKLAPSVSPTVGTTILLQNMSYGFAENYMHQNPYISCVFGAGMSAPLYAVFNGQGMGLSINDSLRKMTRWQCGYIICRETMFLGSLKISKPVSQSLEEMYGKQWYVTNASHFCVGSLGAACSHGFDACLTYDQMESTFKKQVQQFGFKQALTRGMLPRSIATGFFNIVYQNMKENVHQALN